MSNFKKIFGLAGTVMVFTGLAYGQQVNCNTSASAPQANAFLVRAEGTTEQVADLVLTCTNTGAGPSVAGTTLNVQAFLSAPVTSKILTGNSNTASEALLLINAPVGSTPAGPTVGPPPTPGSIFQGIVSGSSVQFNGVVIPVVAPAASITLTITNVRVNASTVTVGTGAPPPITESVFISGAAAVAAATNAIQVAFVAPGLVNIKSNKTFAAGTGNFQANAFTSATSGANNFVVCNSINAAGTTVLNVLQISEGFATAFKGQGGGNVTVGSEFTNNTETGFVPASFPSTGGSNVASSATRIKVVFNNVPANLTLYVPTVIGSATASSGNVAASAGPPPVAAVPAVVSTLTLTSSETGAFSAVSAASTSSTVGANLGAISVSGGTATAVYEYAPAVGASAVSETFNIPVQAVTSSNAVTASTSAITETVSFAPTGSTNIPNFVVGASSAPAVTSSLFNLCTTSLLFPFVTNQLGFDTGLAIANTSSDPFGTNGAAPQAGTCTLNFYGAGAPTPSNVVTPNIPTGTVFTQVLSNVGAGFQGYLIAQCQFQFAHGFAFITDGVGANGGLSQGYLAGVIPDVNQTKRGANPLSTAAAGTGETLGN